MLKKLALWFDVFYLWFKRTFLFLLIGWFLCAVLWVGITYFHHKSINKETDPVVVINGETFVIPEDFRGTRFSSFGLSAPLSFRLSPHTLGAPEKSISEMNDDERRELIKVQLLNSTTYTQKSVQNSFQHVSGRSKGECSEHTTKEGVYDLCRYAPIHHDKASTYFLINKESGDVVTKIRCTDTELYQPPYPSCSSTSVIDGGIQLHYTYRVKDMDKMIEIDTAVRGYIDDFHQEKSE